MLRKLFGAKNEDSGNPVGSTESVVSRIDNNNMPGPIQKVDLWLRQHVPMKKPEDCLYCKIMKCLGIAGGTVWFVSYAPRALKTKCTSVRSTLVYGILTANIALCKYEMSWATTFLTRFYVFSVFTVRLWRLCPEYISPGIWGQQSPRSACASML